MKKTLIIFILIILTGSLMNKENIVRKDYPFKPVSFTEVKFTDNFWLPRLNINRNITIPYDFKKCEETHRIDNFAIAGGLKEGAFKGIRYNDSDVFKVIEGASYSLNIHPDPELEKYLDNLIKKIAAAQEDDGYLYTCRTIDPENLPGYTGATRWSQLKDSHELYNIGHMYEAAVAYFQATGKRSLLDVAIKSADLVNKVFGPSNDQLHGVPGHQEIEIGLVKLYRVTREKKYLKLAKYFLDQRGNAKGHKLYVYGKEGNNKVYTQDHKPVIDQREAVGHAVRAVYMYSGMTDIAALTNDKKYESAVNKLWNNVVSKKLYITGGIGAKHSGEAFGENYYLPNLSAYNETCAAIANMLWNQRMFLLNGDSRYIDVLERTLYNGFLSGISIRGDKFFYPNPLESNGTHERKPWFDCSCCPTNVVRFLPSLPGYVYAHTGDDLFINLYIGNSANINMNFGKIKISQSTNYPWDGNVKINIEPEEKSRFTISLRIPGWAQNKPVPSDLYQYMNSSDKKPYIKINNRKVEYFINKGYARINRYWEKGDLIEIDFPMPVRKVIANKNVLENRKKYSLEKGPIVYCAEWVDNGGKVHNLLLDKNSDFAYEFKENLINGVTVLKGTAEIFPKNKSDSSLIGKKQNFIAIPYYAWAHRGKGEMKVWFPYRETGADIKLHAATASNRGVNNKKIMKKQLKTFILSNKTKCSVEIINFGAKVMSINVPDRKGKIDNIVLGYDSSKEYINGNPYFGAIIGRYGNRIDKGKFTLDNTQYSLAANNGPNHLHGGPEGFHNVIWDVVEYKNTNDQHFIKLKYVSEDGEEGYPGNLTVYVKYSFTDKNELIIEYNAESDKNTIINLTHHSFFNLKDGGRSDILGHELKIFADNFTPVDQELIPTGQILSVKGTPMDFSDFSTIGKRISDEYLQLQYGKGYDHNWVLNNSADSLKPAAIVKEPVSGRKMEVFTTEPGLQFYSGNFLDGSDIGENKTKYNFRSAFCLEAQHYPDSPNHKNFPSTKLCPGKKYKQRTIYKFSTFK
ncbi:MAG: galactose-1-epimerase [Acidobacteriota bacterium]